ncbi:MAG: 5'/3'-nucleotidase SurE [Planctomycetaceae bacterium]|jgi:5'-nucleotidase|nr:5'/3'-nucleotidase SurE [Planctomycetaceae bacterium]
MERKRYFDSGIKNILVTNDDGIYTPSILSMCCALQRLGNRCHIVAPSREQSGVSHSITFLTPITVKNVFNSEEQRVGWAVDGSPADCVKIGVAKILPELPDLIVSGINNGLNAGANVLYSGTVAAAVEGALYGIPSFAVSLEYSEDSFFGKAAEIAVDIIANVLQKVKQDKKIDRDSKKNSGSEVAESFGSRKPSGILYNLNIPIAALSKPKPEVRFVELDMAPDWELFEERFDPAGRPYYWLSGRPDPRQPAKKQYEHLTDVAALRQGFITLSPLDFNLTDRAKLKNMESWQTEEWNLRSDSDL